MKKLLFFITFLASIWHIQDMHATLKNYDTGSVYTMTGVGTPNTPLIYGRFDVASLIYNEKIAHPEITATSPALDPNTLELSGAFYISGYGWADLTGVKLIPGSDVYSYKLFGTGTSELYGDIGFENVELKNGVLDGTAYIPTTDTRVFLAGVSLPFGPVDFIDESEHSLADQIQASGSLTLLANIKSHLTLTIQAGPCSDTAQTILSDSNGIFTNVNLSKLGGCTVTITDTDTQAVTTRSITVIAGAPDMNKSNFKGSFFEGGYRPADGKNTFDGEIILKDSYENPITAGSITLKFKDKTTTNPFFGAPSQAPTNMSSPPTASASSGIIWSGGLTNTISTINVTGVPILTKVASVAPSEDALEWESLSYTYNGKSSPLNITGKMQKLKFEPLVRVSLTSSPRLPNQDVTFIANIEKQGDSTNPPTNIEVTHGFQIGYRNSYFSKMGGTEMNCTYDKSLIVVNGCIWISGPLITDSTIRLSLSDSLTSYTFTGFYSTGVSSPPNPESVSYSTIIGYKVKRGVTDEQIYYAQTPKVLTWQPSSPDEYIMKVIGQNSTSGSVMRLDSQVLSDTFSRIRKNLANLSRNVIDYTNLNYDVTNGNKELKDTDFSTKRTIFIIGGEATITGNILRGTREPLAIIALTDESGNGGVIRIASGVTRIDATLVAERGILAVNSDENKNQLSIYGTLLSANSLTNECPKMTPNCTSYNVSEYNLKNLRAGFMTLPETEKTQRRAPGISPALKDYAFIVEQDTRVLTNPPIGLQ